MLDSKPNLISLILLTHGHLCDSIYQTSKLMLGEQTGVHCISTANYPPSEVEDQVLAIVEKQRQPDEGVLIAVDLKGGSTWNVACRLAHERKNIAVISGMNLPILLTFFNLRQSLSLDQMVEKLLSSGKQSIDRYPTGPKSE